MHRLLPWLLLLSPEVLAAGGGDGPDWKGMAFHGINLIILLSLIAWFAGPTIRDSLKNRRASVLQELEASERARAEAEAQLAELNNRLAALEGEISSLKESAEAEGRREAERIREQTERESARLRESAQASIQGELQLAQRQLRRDAVELAVELAETKIRQRVTQEDQQRMAEDMLHTLSQESQHG